MDTARKRSASHESNCNVPPYLLYVVWYSTSQPVKAKYIILRLGVTLALVHFAKCGAKLVKPPKPTSYSQNHPEPASYTRIGQVESPTATKEGEEADTCS